MNQSFNYNKKNPTMDINNEDGNYIAKSQVDVKNLEIFEFKVILIGDPGVGKTSILSRFVTNEFQSVYTSTIGVEFKTKDIYINNTTCASFKIWDTCGQEKFRAITRQYFKDAHGVILVYDVSNENSFRGLNVWLNEIRNNANMEVTIILVGNKIDILDRKISQKEANEYALKNGLLYVETSSKEGINIDTPFENLANDIIKKIKENLDSDYNESVEQKLRKINERNAIERKREKEVKCC